MTWAIVATVGLDVLLLVLVAIGSDDPGGADGRQPFGGFRNVAFAISPAGREAQSRRCALLADTEALQNRGLMGRTDLGGYDGMLFVYSADTTTTFYMENTPMPLSIAWFDAEGNFVSAADMEPCLGRTDCPLYSAARAYRVALEVPQGGLGALGVGPGSHLDIGGGC